MGHSFHCLKRKAERLPMKKRERWLVFLIGCCHTMVHFYEQIFPALLLTIVVVFGIDIATAGWMQTLLGLAFGLGALPAGYIADKVGSKRIIMVYLIGAGLSCIFIAMAHSVAALAVGLAAMGACISLYHPAGTTLISTQVKDVGKSLGYHGIGGGLGLATAPALATLIASLHPQHGWRISFALFGFLGLLTAAGVSTLRVTEIDRSPNQTRRLLPERVAKGSPASFIMFLFVAVMIGFCYRGVTTYLPAYYSQRLTSDLFAGHDVLKGGAFATITLLVGVVGQYFGGHLTSKFKLENLFAGLMLISVPFLLLMSFLSNLSLLFISMLFAFFHFSSQPVGNTLIAEYTDPRGRGIGYGLYFATSFGVGSLSAGFSGMIAKRFGLNEVFLVLAVFIFIGFLMMIYLSKRRVEPVEVTLDVEAERVV
jgi:FSR family fosmidomycin resistance protein-like MFS transporter